MRVPRDVTEQAEVVAHHGRANHHSGKHPPAAVCSLFEKTRDHLISTGPQAPMHSRRLYRWSDSLGHKVLDVRGLS